MDMSQRISPTLTDSERAGPPTWIYTDPEFFELEKDELFRRTWQLACHISDVPETGSYLAFDIAGERALILRGKDGEVRAFHNLCRHRGSRVVASERGSCKSAVVCPFHGWSYNLDGTLRAVPQARFLPKLDPREHGLLPVECEIWMGFVFVRFQKGSQPAVAELMASHSEDIARYQPRDAKPYGPMTSQVMEVNWKSVRDVDNEGYHVPIAHPGLQDLYGNNYRDEVTGFGVTRSVGSFNETHDKLWSVRNYKKVLRQMPGLSAAQQSSWFYYGIFPNIVIMLYPDMIGFYQDIPLAAGLTAQRFGYYSVPDERRETRASRYLAMRIDRETGAEDAKLIEWSYEAMQSSAYRGTILSDLEHGVSEFHRMLRQLLPVAGLPQPPSKMQEVNVGLRSKLPPAAWGR